MTSPEVPRSPFAARRPAVSQGSEQAEWGSAGRLQKEVDYFQTTFVCLFLQEMANVSLEAST